MNIIPMFLKELEQEAQTTRKMLERVPTDKFQWQPHPKSMNIQHLAGHIAELPGWITMVLNTDELDFAQNAYKPEPLSNTPELLNFFERNLESGKAGLQSADENNLSKIWTLRNGDIILNQSTKAEFIRMTYCQIVHHRAQLGVYLRLLDIPIPGSYGPSADEDSSNFVSKNEEVASN